MDPELAYTLNMISCETGERERKHKVHLTTNTIVIAICSAFSYIDYTRNTNMLNVINGFVTEKCT